MRYPVDSIIRLPAKDQLDEIGRLQDQYENEHDVDNAINHVVVMLADRARDEESRGNVQIANFLDICRANLKSIMSDKESC